MPGYFQATPRVQREPRAVMQAVRFMVVPLGSGLPLWLPSTDMNGRLARDL